jgi:predicted RNase H-like nuclease (RuvC/YqgF family)
MSTLYITQVGSALEAELAAKNQKIEELEKEIMGLQKQRNHIMRKWEDCVLGRQELEENEENKEI